MVTQLRLALRQPDRRTIGHEQEPPPKSTFGGSRAGFPKNNLFVHVFYICRIPNTLSQFS